MSSFFQLIFSGYEILTKFGLYVLVLVGFFLLFKKPTYAYFLTVFTIPFKSLYIWAGTNLEVWKLMSAMALCLYGPKVLIDSSHRLRRNPYFPWLVLFAAYALCITVLFPLTIPDKDKHIMTGGFFKNEGRIFFQIIFFLITINLILWPSYIFNSSKQVFISFRIIVLSVTTLAVMGLVQLLSLYIIGFDPFPIHRIYGFDNTGGLISTHGFSGVQRLNSLAGEPKHFAIALIIGLLILLVHRVNKVRIINHELPIIAIFFVCLLATYSTTGYIWFAITLVFLFVLYPHKLTGSSLLVILLLALSIYFANTWAGAGNYSYIEKAVGKTGLEVQDEAVFGYFKANPIMAATGVGLGNIHKYAVNYLPYNFPIFRDTPFKANTGFFLLLGDVGLIGIFLLSIFVFKLIHKKRRKRKLEERKEGNITTHIVLVSCVLFFLRYFELYFVLLGLMMFFKNQTNKIYK